MRNARLLLVTLLALVFGAFGCGSGDDSGQANGSDSTTLSAASGSMESDAENVGQKDDQQAEEEKPKKKKKEKSTTVRASLAFNGDLVMPVIAEGTIRARNSAEIRTEIAGKITRVYAAEGQRLKRGQMIAKIDDREYSVAAEEARAAYLQALSLLAIEDDDITVTEVAQQIRDQFTNLEKQERRGQITHEQRLAQEIELDVKALKEGSFRLEVAAARSGVSGTRTQLERARLNLERTEIRAPFAGVVTGLELSAGEQVITNETICTVIDDINIEAEVGVLEADLGHVSLGRPTLLAVPALGETLSVTVDVISPQFDRTSRTCRVLLRVSSKDGRLRPGMFVRAIIAGKTFHDRLLVPREAILTREGRPLLFKVADGRSQWLYVELGAANDNLIEITKVVQGGRLEPGDKVVVTGHLTLAHDAKIKVKKTLPNKDPWVNFPTEDG